ncbi:MAG: hypothetical protein EBT14_03990, partial [Betaproteobacteria bacterium]|nr:hypothetical protein [Betaproteobacteria bacterium]
MDMAILTGLPPSARASAGSSGQNGADAGIEALLAGRALAGEAGNDSSGATGSDPFSAALQVALSRVGAGLQEEQQALLDAAALAAQGQVGQILPNGVIMSPDQQANFAAGTPTSDAQLQAIDAAAQLTSQTAGQAVNAALAQQTGDLADQAAAQQVVLATQANAAAQDTALVTGQPTLGSSQAQQTASVVQLTPEQLAQAQAAAAQQTAAQGDESQGVDVDPALLANLPAQANVGNASTTANGQQAAANVNGMVGLVQAGNGQQTANQQAANDDQQQSAAGDTAGLLSAVIDESTKDSAERFNLVMDGKQIGAPAMAANANTQSAQLVGQLSANGQANAQALNAAQTPAGTVVADIQTATESASTQMAARTES